MAIEWADSSSKHGIPRADALWALSHAIVVSDLPAGRGHFDIGRKVFIGPAHPQTDRLLEVLVAQTRNGYRIYHVMNLGSAFEHLLGKD